MIHRLHKHSGQRQQSTATVVTSTTSTGAPLSGKGRIVAGEVGDTRAIHAPFGVGDARLVAAPSSAPTGLLAEGHQHDDGETSAIHSSPVRHERRWRKSRRVLVKMVCVTLAGALTLVLTGEGLTNTLGSLARITPLLDYTLPGPASWTEAVAGCTGPKDGYVFGGDTGNILTFVRRRRGREGSLPDAVKNGGGGTAGGSPALPDVLRWFWKLKHDRGVLAYEVEELETRRGAAGQSGWEVVFASNVGRHKIFPPAGPAEAPWEPSSFNFYKASPLEFLLSYTPSFRYEREAASTAAATAEEAAEIGQQRALTSSAGVSIGTELETRRAARAARQDEMAAGPSLRGASAGDTRSGGGLYLQPGVLAAKGSDGGSSVACTQASTASPPQDAVLVNIRPVGPVSLLLTPGYPDSHNQRAWAESLAVAMDFAEELMVDPGFRLGFNSAGSSASVNHLHFQCWHFDAGPDGLPIETAESTHLTSIPLTLRRGSSPLTTGERGLAEEGGSAAAGGGLKAHEVVEVHTLKGYPIRTLVFHTLGKDLEAIGEVMERCVNLLVEENTPHTVVFSTGRAFLLPRQHLVEPPFAVVPGFPEVSGEIIVTKEEDFRTITADQVYEWWTEKVGVSAEYFDRIIAGCVK